MEEQLQELVVVDNKEEVKGQHSNIMLIGFDEELKILDDNLINPRIDKGDYITVAGTECSEILSYNIAEERDENLIQTNSKKQIVVPHSRGMDEEKM